MMDALGNPVTAAAPATLAAIDDFVMGFLAYEPRAVNILAAAEADPECGLAQAYAAMLWMFAEAEGAEAKARPFAEAALRLTETATERERLIARTAMQWVEGDVPGLLATIDGIVAAHPRDLAMVKLAQYHLFNAGDCVNMLRIARAALPQADDIPYIHGMIAFGYEQCHLLDDAEAAARRAIAMQRAEPWAHHALAHVFLTRGQVDEGIAFLESVADTWEGLNSFMHTHNWWHLALFYLSRGRHDDLLAAYDTHVWGREKGYSQDQVGAASLLARMELAGVDVGDRWHDVAEHIAARGPDTLSPFLTMQYLYALGRTGREEADALMQAVEARARRAEAFDHAVWRDVALPACRGLLAHTRGDWARCIRDLGQALPRLIETGGSHAQRDLFEQIHLDALMKAGRIATAQQVLEMRRSYDPDGVPVNRMLASLYAEAGLPDEAARAEARAARTLASQGAATA